MNIETVLNEMQKSGFSLTVIDENKLSVIPGDQLTDTQCDFIRLHKPELIKVLSQHKTPDLTNSDRQNFQEYLEERAAIQEYDGGLSRSEAEQQARSNIRVFHYRLTDDPGSWLVMIAPGCDLDEAKRVVNAKFGSDRIMDIREYQHAWEKPQS